MDQEVDFDQYYDYSDHSDLDGSGHDSRSDDSGSQSEVENPEDLEDGELQRQPFDPEADENSMVLRSVSQLLWNFPKLPWPWLIELSLKESLRLGRISRI